MEGEELEVVADVALLEAVEELFVVLLDDVVEVLDDVVVDKVVERCRLLDELVVAVEGFAVEVVVLLDGL